MSVCTIWMGSEMTDLPKPHKHAAVIHAFADGKEIQFRWYSGNSWGAWFKKPDTAPFHDDLNYEYRVKPEQEPHKWQKEREAFLAGKTVHFRNTEDLSGGQTWYKMTAALEHACRKDGESVWDRDWLEFKVMDNRVARYYHAYGDTFGVHMNQDKTRPHANLKLVFDEGKLISAMVLQ